MRNVLWAVIAVGATSVFAEDVVRDKPATRWGERYDIVAPFSGPSSQVPQDPKLNLELGEPGAMTLEAKRLKLKELEAALIDQFDEEVVDRRLSEAQVLIKEKRAAVELRSIVGQLSKLAEAYPETTSGKQARRALDALRAPQSTDAPIEPTQPRFLLNSRDARGTVPSVDALGEAPMTESQSDESLQARLDQAFVDSVVPKLLEASKSESIPELEAKLERHGMSLSAMKMSWSEGQLARRRDR